ncbi:MAG: 2-succinyl-5-enolpyruvyl-6-hydroxy-3-cyclohexene-1-carboxylic-acid synthase [Cyanobacteria bacterium P01_H01_bin.15]
MLDFRNVNTLWASVLVETWRRLGLAMAVVCPGSRSTPLTVALARHLDIITIPVLDERSASFFALGLAKKAHQPVILVSTSGTAAANFYPAIIEAHHSQVPLLVLTADRPPEARACRAGQAIDQHKLFGDYPNWQQELALPEAEIPQLKYARQVAAQAWEQSLYPQRGAVHLNCPFREPLSPIPQMAISRLRGALEANPFWTHLQPGSPQGFVMPPAEIPFERWQSGVRGLIVVGLEHPLHPERYAQQVAMLARQLQWPVLADGVSPIRNYQSLNPWLITTYDCLLRRNDLRSRLAPELVIQIGDLPTSKELRSWLESVEPTRWIVSPTSVNSDPLHGPTVHLRLSLGQLVNWASRQPSVNTEVLQQDYLKQWLSLQNTANQEINRRCQRESRLMEPKIAWGLSQWLPAETRLFVANSMSVRQVEWFWQLNDHKIQPFCNRGANGIDGTLSTALGIAYGGASVALVGDLALLHDTNGFLISPHFEGHLTLVVVNNKGGGIFEQLPIAGFDPPFEKYFATPQRVELDSLAAAYGVEYQLISNWSQLKELITQLPERGIRLLEIPCDRKYDARWLKTNLPEFGIVP